MCNTTRTVRNVINRYGSIMNIPITPSLQSTYRNSHRKYTEALENAKAQIANQSVLGKRKLPLEDYRDYMTQTKKREWEQKQQQAEKLICEGTDRSTAALKAGKMIDVLPAQALLESGSKLLKECRHEIEELNKQLAPGHHQPSKSFY